MFYLLEDNRIIETEKEYEVEYIKDSYFNSQNEYKFVYVKDFHYQGFQVLRNATTEETIGFIKNQSENVFDLVECYQDLIETEEGQFYKPLKLQIDSFVVKYDCRVLFNGIKTIYKPDDKGNYIKVWEREKEDETCNGTD